MCADERGICTSDLLNPLAAVFDLQNETDIPEDVLLEVFMKVKKLNMNKVKMI